MEVIPTGFSFAEHTAHAGHTGHTEHAVLKLYDRRYATELRQSYGISPFSHEIEQKFEEFVRSGDAARFIDTLETDEVTDLTWDTARDEAFLFDYCRELHKSETEAYHRLSNLQGKNVPKLLANVQVQPSSNEEDILFQVPGVLLEYVEGFSLADLPKFSPPSSWQRICDEAVSVVNLISDQGIINKDVKPRNVLVRSDGHSLDCAVVFIDFAQCEFAESGQSEEVWRHEKRLQDEEGAIGHVMVNKLKGVYNYQPSYRFQCSCNRCTNI